MCCVIGEPRIVIKTGMKELAFALFRVPMGAGLPGELLLKSLHFMDLVLNKLSHCEKIYMCSSLFM